MREKLCIKTQNIRLYWSPCRWSLHHGGTSSKFIRITPFSDSSRLPMPCYPGHQSVSRQQDASVYSMRAKGETISRLLQVDSKLGQHVDIKGSFLDIRRFPPGMFLDKQSVLTWMCESNMEDSFRDLTDQSSQPGYVISTYLKVDTLDDTDTMWQLGIRYSLNFTHSYIT